MVQQQANQHPITKYTAEAKHFQQGATGQVFVAYDKETNRNVAIKVIPLATESLKQTFVNETKLLNKMNCSQFTTRMKECFVFQNRGYIVLELFDMDLYTRSEEFGGIEEIKDIFLQVCLAVQELHQHNIAHLDLKPENILVDMEDNIKLCDFGSSFEWKNNTYNNKLIGSDFFLAPEVLSYQKGYDAPRADIWSLGIVLYMMITGSYPYAGNTREECLQNYFEHNLNFDELRTALPDDEDCYDLLTRILCKDTTARATIDDIFVHPWLCSDETEWSL